jgi:drug/metabolite transporter superfamily protein YnfA
VDLKPPGRHQSPAVLLRRFKRSGLLSGRPYTLAGGLYALVCIRFSGLSKGKNGAGFTGNAVLRQGLYVQTFAYRQRNMPHYKNLHTMLLTLIFSDLRRKHNANTAGRIWAAKVSVYGNARRPGSAHRNTHAGHGSTHTWGAV